MVMATVRYCEDCTVTIWVPGEGDPGMAGVTIAARDTLRWLTHNSYDVCLFTWFCQAEGESHEAAGVF